MRVAAVKGAVPCYPGPTMGHIRQTRRSWLINAGALGLGWLASGGPTDGWARAPVYLPIHFHVTHQAARPVAEPAFLAQQLESANRIFMPYGVQFVQAGVGRGEGPPVAISRADRDRFAPQVAAGVINCFVVARLMDVDEPGKERRGVHWHERPAPRRHYVLLSTISEPGVLAHELGHFLGNRAHSQTQGNLMSYDWAGQQPVLTAVQVRRMRQTLRRLIQSGELQAVSR